ncbi:hypothetical protein VTJ83DRAFT_6534 [Remersonia thermophila]|uniref:Cytochrome b561 domain-containing protein n=1 Tax=Remersonia thermophila TaxID=72144 RepID=A0ABR4D4Z5_9PEZI
MSSSPPPSGEAPAITASGPASAAPETDPSPPTESAPLLGRPGDATQKPDSPLSRNLVLGTAWLAQLGALVLLATVLVAVLTHPALPLVTPHPLLQTLGVVAVVQAVLVLQPTFTPEAKAAGQTAHAALQALAVALLVAGAAVIEANKRAHGLPHFHSAHAYLGVATLALLALQGAFGLTIWAVPRVWGGVDQAKALWKYHRWVGYAVLISLLATVTTAAKTDYVKKVLEVKFWPVLLGVALIVAGVFPRIHPRKLGIQRS